MRSELQLVPIRELWFFLSLCEGDYDFFKELLVWNRIFFCSAGFIIIATVPPHFSKKPLIPFPSKHYDQKRILMREVEPSFRLFCALRNYRIVGFNEVKKAGKSM